ncbi:Carboxylesterase 2 [Moraxella lacunata]|uniref:Carboxylesterase 2 n=1 Tax=Moraxella lacunata TaxID=477 RepID=A0A378T5S4_MORLA|nr:carboxylesterase [Moraxella lacunata]STZ55517.1 Carboxylesterase 2 [Moraxella lacunata]
MVSLLPFETVIHNPKDKPIEHAVIWLHGLGANGHDFVPVVPELRLSDELGVRFIFPHAPSIPVTVNGGYVMPAWYDILEMSLDRKVDTAQIKASSERINDLIDEQVHLGIPSQNIIIAGFSQGGAVAYHNALTNSRPLAGLLALSTYLATEQEIGELGTNASLPVKIDHGDYDDVVPSVLGVKAIEKLTTLGLSPEFKRYGMAHQVCMEQIKDIGKWMNKVFDKS